MTDPVVPVNERRTVLIATAGQTEFQFDFAGVGSAADLRVYRNGADEGAFTLNAGTKMVTLTVPAENDGDSIVIEGRMAIQRDESYPRGGPLETRLLNPEMNDIYRMMQELRRDVDRAITLSKAQVGASNVLPLFEEAGRALVSSPDGIALSGVNVNDLDAALTAAEGFAGAASQSAGAAAQSLADTQGVFSDTEGVFEATETVRDEAVAARDAAQASAAGMKWRPSVKVATTANITLAGLQTIDGISVSSGERVLVKSQSTASQNGVYVVAAGVWSRATDADSWAELVSQVVVAEEGTDLADQAFICTVNQGGALGSTAVSWAPLNPPLADGVVTWAKLALSLIASASEILGGAANKLISAAGLKAIAPNMVLQTVYVQNIAHGTTTNPIPYDDTVPQITEGLGILEGKITPKSANSKLLVIYKVRAAVSGKVMTAAAFLNGGVNAVDATDIYASGGTNIVNTFGGEFVTTVADTNEHTVNIRVGAEDSTPLAVNGGNSGRRYGGAGKCTLIIMEISQ